MPGDDFGDKTEEPTERRRNEARQKGNVARSTDLNSAGMMLAAASAMLFFGIPVFRGLTQLMHASLQNAGRVSFDIGTVPHQFREIADQLLNLILPVMLWMMGAAFLLNLLQVGVLIAPEALQPKFERLNPIAGAKRILSIRGLVKLAVSLAKLLLVVAVAGWSISAMAPTFLNLIGTEPPGILFGIRDSVLTLAFQLAIALIILAILDFGFQKWKHEQDLRMTKQEVREEMKNMEGDPMIRQRRREIHRKLAEAREMQQVQDADVVITNPTHIAVALKYDPETMPAPTVVAKGMGVLAGRIRQIAVEHGVPIIERKPLARSLYRDVKVGHQISVEMYEVFVEIMAYVYRISGRTPPSLP